MIQYLASGIGGKIIGGSVVQEIGKYPWFVSLVMPNWDPRLENRYKKFSKWDPARACGGVLIDAEWVLTAAHCFQPHDITISPDDVVQYLGVIVGAFRTPTLIDNGGQSFELIKVAWVHLHPGYVPDKKPLPVGTVGFDNDFALLKLQKKSQTTPMTIDGTALSESYTSGEY